MLPPLTDCTLAVLCHMAGENGNARVYLQRRIDEAAISYEELYRRMHKDRRGSWLRRLWGESRWSEEKVAKDSRANFRILSEGAEAARKLADGFGIRLD